jgi:cellulose synthase/poly-beta-1,6-N-acetylglucosamine synthase-like glycosyltransferase
MTEIVLWLSASALFYSFLGYGLVLLALAGMAPARPEPPSWAPRRVDFLIAAYNEEAVIADKLANTLALDSGGADVHVVLVSDGSTDATAEIGRSFESRGVTVLTSGRIGKAAALALGLERCTGEVVVFSDANAMLSDRALTAMLRHFAYPAVGGVCGRIGVAPAKGRKGGLGFAEGLFWRYDQALKRAESRLGGAVSAQGSVYAMRRELVRAPTAGFADDFVISVEAVRAGKRLVFEPGAGAAEVVAETAKSEMSRRIRSAELSWRSMMQFADLMNPLRYGWYAWQLISHKLVRRLNPLFLVLLFLSSAVLATEDWRYALVFVGQVAFYGLALAALLRPELRRFRIVSIAAFFLMAHAAMALGFFRYASGRQSTLWTPSREGA